MPTENLEELLQGTDDVIDMLRSQGGAYKSSFPVVPNEHTNWIDELRACVETAALSDLSHHMTALHLKGPDAIDLLKDLCVNDFDNFDVGRGKQIIMCNHHGHVMGDGPLLRLDDDEFYGPGVHATKWLKFNLETNDYDVEAEIEPPTPLLPGDPDQFVHQLQGPKAYDILDKLTDDDFRDIGFYRFDDITVAGREIRAFGHGMSPEAGFEFHGPYEYAAELREAIVNAGEEFGLKELGSKVYVANSVRLGWVPPFLKPVYDIPEMKAYRQWADAEKEEKYGKLLVDDKTLEGSFSIEGSFESDDIRDYYMTPIDLGYKRLIDFDHDFIGKEALQKEAENQQRTLVTLKWDTEDVNKVQNSIFRKGENYKYMDDLPRLGWARAAFDRVEKDGELVGISRSRSYHWDVRGVLSLCSIDMGYSEPGTEVTLIWGEPGGTTPNPTIEDHTQTTIKATVKPAPYIEDKR